MVAVKERLSYLKDRATQGPKMSSTGEVKNLKIYVESDNVTNRQSLNNAYKGKSVTHGKEQYPLTADAKKIIKKSGISKIKPVTENAGRKVLGDIGNVRRSTFSKTEKKKSSWSGCRKGKSDAMLCPRRKGKSEQMVFQERDAVDMGNMEPSTSDKQSRDNTRFHQIQVTDDNQTLRKTVRKSIKPPHELRTKFQGRSSAAASGRKSAGIPLHLTSIDMPVLLFTGRKSLPALNKAIRVETSGTAKDNSEKSDKIGGKHGFPVRPSVKRSTVPKPSTVKSRPWGNRVSDGFIVMASRAQTKVDARLLSRKSVKPTVKATATSLNAQTNTKPKHMLTTKNLRSKPADLSKREQGKNIHSLVSQEEPSLEEDTSGSTVILRRKSDRRNSYTGSLVSRSKFLKEHSRVPSEETLPSIYDDRNHLEVCEYVDDIYQYYWVMEGQNPLLKNYMEKQRDITRQMRGILINWLVEVHLRFDLMEETLFLTVTLLDRYLSLESIRKNEMQLVGLTALLLASKYEDFWHPRVTDLISISAESYSRDEMLKMEKAILKKLKFRLNEPTPYVFMLRFLKAAQSDMKLCLVEYEALNYKASMLCASAIYVARCTMQMAPYWTPLLAKHARYEESKIRDCAEMILKFHKAAKTSLLKVTYEKYSKPDYSRVATIKPLNRLPA
ncbi:cyclin [Striga asiatica]|uniref:Cyclin n=1 Tax=Striga asiatica TaxID=4170 RepID=A0A5A7PNG9_STRAF|nr:cyclin [Striga asiatica]